MSKKRANPAYSAVDKSKTEIRVFIYGAKSGVKLGGAYRDRTDDPLLAKQVLSQLS